MKKLTEKQRRFIKANHPKLTSGEMARRLQVDKAVIDRYLAARALPAKKKIIFTSILLLLPILTLAGLEIALRLFHYGPNLDLILTREKGGQKYYALNPEAGKRYFSSGIAAVPELYEETFAYHKPKNGYRIFCLGESTTASFPYELNARFHRLLQDRLATLFPGKNIEVINVGLSAVNSFTVREFAEELADYAPDLFLLYLGHNEFYGAFGVGSTQYLGQSRGVILLYLWLQKFKTFQLLRNAMAAMKGVFQKSPPPAAGQTLMEQMVRSNQYIAFGSEDYQRAASSFRKNLADIIQTAKKNNVGILVGTLASNLKDQEPFYSLFSPATTTEAKARWGKFFQRGMELENQGAFTEALASYQQANALDGTPAKLHFHMGKCYEALQRYDEALAAFQKARDDDALRFRAAGEFNEIIRQVCREANVPVVEMEQAFAAHSPNGIAGRELICEHLHPNFAGYFLMAKTFCAAIAENNFIADKQDWKWPLNKTDEEYKDLSAVTEFDVAIGAFKIERLTSHWPFQSPVMMNLGMDESSASLIRRFVAAYSQEKISWNEAHYQLAEYYAVQKQFDRAEKEYRAVIKIIPENYHAYFKMGELYLAQERFSEAEAWLKQALQRHPRSPFVFAKLATAHFSNHAYDKAIAYFDSALALNKMSGEFSAAEAGWAEYYKAMSHLQLGQKKEGMEALAEVVRLQPSNAQARQLLALLQSNADVRLQFTK
jgi:tetratricopeptide (TPR) repeat protein